MFAWDARVAIQLLKSASGAKDAGGMGVVYVIAVMTRVIRLVGAFVVTTITRVTRRDLLRTCMISVAFGIG